MPKQVTFNTEETLDRLVPLFIEKGYNGTSMQDIVDASQLNRSSIYNSFGDKQALFLSVLERYAGRQLRLKEEILKLDENALIALKKFFLNLFLKPVNPCEVNGCLLTNCSLELGQSDKSVQELLLNSKELMISNFEEVLNIGIQQGTVKKSLDTQVYALILYNNLQGLRVINGGKTDEKSTQIIIKTLFEKI
ncbi:MAG: TetR/AcrR family transcriptional regulator [Bacteroidota bacterium]